MRTDNSSKHVLLAELSFIAKAKLLVLVANIEVDGATGKEGRAVSGRTGKVLVAPRVVAGSSTDPDGSECPTTPHAAPLMFAYRSALPPDSYAPSSPSPVAHRPQTGRAGSPTSHGGSGSS